MNEGRNGGMGWRKGGRVVERERGGRERVCLYYVSR